MVGMGFSQARKTLSTTKDGMDVQATFEGLLNGGGGGSEETYHLPPPQSGRYPTFYWYPDHSQPEALCIHPPRPRYGTGSSWAGISGTQGEGRT